MKEEYKKEKITTIIFIIIIFVIMIASIIRGYNDIYDEIKNTFINTEVSNFDKIKEITGQTEIILNENIEYKEQFINIYGLMQRMIGSNVIEDKNDDTKTIIKLKNNMITFIQKEENMDEKANKIAELNERLSEFKIPLIYIQAPYKVKSNDYLPIGIQDYSNKNADKLLEVLNEKNVNNIDMRTVFKDKKVEDEFFYTDHHWRIETAFESANYVTNYLNESFEFNIDEYYTNIENYKIITSDKRFLGSIGKRIGKYYAGTDKFNYIIPNFTTEMTVKNEYESKELYGKFEDTIISNDLLEGQDTTDNQYACYFGADYPEIIINNNNSNSNKKVLIIQDSFGLPFSAMMSLRVKELRILDLRHYDNSEIEYIKDYNPDIVMIIYNPSSFYIDKIFEFE